MATTSNIEHGAPARRVHRAPAWRERGIFVDGDVRVATFEAGRTDPEAPTLVLVHGLGHWTQACWDFTGAELESSYRLVAYDQPGFGRSSKPDRTYPLEFFVRALAGVVEAYGLQHFALAGHSLGGLVAAEYAGGNPPGLRGLALIDPAGFLRTPKLLIRMVGSGPVTALFRSIRPSRGFVRRTFKTAVFDPSVLDESMHAEMYRLSQDPEMTRAFARVYRDALQAFLNLPALHAGFARWKGPTQLVWGREDKYVPIRALAAAQKVYPHAETTVLERCGHCPTIEYPAVAAGILRRLPA
jgi:4,5:9,10-diseco-3-hydroxy-5,9,17-trioxoandrosta-1(10),2-diene-4-oate hydrolase